MTVKLHVEEEGPRSKRDGPNSVADQVDAVGARPTLCLVSDRRSARVWESFDRRMLDPRYRCRAPAQR
jgi:hypothetical protein